MAAYLRRRRPERAQTALKGFADREGHASVPLHHHESGVALGNQVATWRAEWRAGMLDKRLARWLERASRMELKSSARCFCARSRPAHAVRCARRTLRALMPARSGQRRLYCHSLTATKLSTSTATTMRPPTIFLVCGTDHPLRHRHGVIDLLIEERL